MPSGFYDHILAVAKQTIRVNFKGSHIRLHTHRFDGIEVDLRNQHFHKVHYIQNNRYWQYVANSV